MISTPSRMSLVFGLDFCGDEVANEKSQPLTRLNKFMERALIVEATNEYCIVTSISKQFAVFGRCAQNHLVNGHCAVSTCQKIPIY
jgi:hypothetical protein